MRNVTKKQADLRHKLAGGVLIWYGMVGARV
jgi:hypothetical protein